MPVIDTDYNMRRLSTLNYAVLLLKEMIYTQNLGFQQNQNKGKIWVYSHWSQADNSKKYNFYIGFVVFNVL